VADRTAKQRLGEVMRERLRARREQLGITQGQLASLLRCHPSLIAHFEGGARLPSLVNLCRLANALATSADYLLGRVALLALLLLTGCAEAHGRIEGPPLYVHLCDAMPAADAEAWGAAAAGLNAEREQAAVYVGHGPPDGCDTVDVCPSSEVLADAETSIGTCVVTIRYAPGTAREVAAQELDLLLEALP
jgi:transcriptional regulator with XRE-family HTH domain